MPEAIAGHVIVPHFRNTLGAERLPFRGPLGRPSARTAGCSTREARRLDENLKFLRQRLPVDTGEPGGEPDMVQQTLLVVETQEQRSDDALLRRIAEAAQHAVRGSHPLDLHHGARAGLVGIADPLGDDAVERPSGAAEPPHRFPAIVRERRKTEVRD